MGKLYFNQNQLIRLIILILISFLVKNSYAEWKAGPSFPGSNGSVRPLYDSSKVNLNPNTMYKTDTGHYGFKTTISQTIEHVPTGATRAGVPTIFEAQVSRKAVLSGAFGLVKRGAALGTRLSGWGTAAYFAYEAYQAVKSSLESEGYEYNENLNEFIKPYENALCLRDRAVNSCVGLDKSIVKAALKGGQSAKDANKLAEMLVEKDFRSASKLIIADRYKGAYFKNCAGDVTSGVSCEISTGTLFWYGFTNRHVSETLTEEKFLQIATPSIDAKPTPFVEGTGKPQYKENIKVPAGTVVTIGPVTPENGKPVQVTITFGQDSNGNTTANVATTQRPDLDPGSPEAPKSKPDGNSDSNPDGKPDKKPDDKPDSDDKPDKRPDDKPDPDDDPSDKDKRKEDKKDDKKEESKGLLCDFFPNILACDKMGKPEKGMFDDIKIPQVTDEKTWDSDNFLPPNGVCPQPKSFNIWGRPVQISYEPLCVFMEKVRFAVLLGFIIMSAFIVFGSLRKG